MKVAIVQISSVQVTCPYCNAMQECAYGDAYDVNTVIAGEVWECRLCKQAFRIPVRVERWDLKEDQQLPSDAGLHECETLDCLWNQHKPEEEWGR